MKPAMRTLTAGLLAALCCARLSAADLTLVANGKPGAAIITAAEPHALRAAAAIRKYIEKMSGAHLPIIKEDEAPRLPVSIFVGHTAAARRFGVKIPAGFNPAIRPEVFEEEGFVIKTKGANLFIGGNSDGPYQGTIYGAYEFLERLGCRWYSRASGAR